MKQAKIFTAVKVLAFIGIFLAFFLLWERYFTPPFQPCNINATVNCDAIIRGVVADTLGIPTPLIGLAGYIAILLGAIYRKRKIVLAMASFGLLFCLWIGYRELFQLKVVCPVCILCDLDMISLFVLALILQKKRVKL